MTSKIFNDLLKSFVTSDKFPLQGCPSSKFLFKVGRSSVAFVADSDKYIFEKL